VIVLFLDSYPIPRLYCDFDDPESPSMMVSMLHVLSIPETPSFIIPRTFPASFTPDARTVRNRLIDWIAQEALAGDLDAAEWVLLSAISKTYGNFTG